MSNVPPVPQYPPSANYQHAQPVADPPISKLAIAAFICGLVFCVPALTPVAAIALGIIAMIVIASSNGRVRGYGFAISGLVLGLLVGVGQIALFVKGSSALLGVVAEPPRRLMMALEQGDLEAARAQMDPRAARRVSDEQMQTFFETVSKDVGELKDVSFDFYQSAIAASPNFKGIATNLNASPNAVQTQGMKFEFEEATYFGATDMRPNQGATSLNGALLVVNISVVVGEDTFHLVPPAEPSKDDDDGSENSAETSDSNEA